MKPVTLLRLALAVASLVLWAPFAGAATPSVPADPGQLFETVLQKATAGDADYVFLLGEFYETGVGTTKDETEASRWYAAAVADGHPGAQARLGMLYLEGRGVPEDLPAGIKLLELSAAQGHPLGLGKLGLATINGTGVPQNLGRGQQLLEQAAEAGDGAAAYEVAKLYLFGRTGPIDKEAAAKWFERSSALGHPTGQYVWARDYVTDPDEQLRLYFLAAHGEQRHAQYDLGRYFEARSDREEAVRWYRRSARNGYQTANQALFKLGLPDVDGNMPFNSTIPSTADTPAPTSDDLLAWLFAAGITIAILAGDGDGAPSSEGSDGPLYCNYGEVDLGGFCGPMSCSYGEFDAGGFCMSYPDDWLN